jgi:hypothetical protein
MKTGIYQLKIFNYDRDFECFPVKVKILRESKKSYLVELLERGPLGQHIGTKYWPRKRNVVNIMESETE